ncbi:11208_t:CDS:2 [Paraglomus brasilianum]|uniref:11208_t:CDS:1 n=1 Tax=Paraglomus brasilianum TaxID=144538 RepID=A0A9N8ZGH5_9GLOM|nr:11208_t:CDS:2 [Paraglomus brasilianum]
MSDQSALSEELLALSSIFGDESFYPVDPNNPLSPYILRINLTSDSTNQTFSSPKSITLTLYFPSTYPSQDPPVYEINSLYCGTLKIEDEIKKEIHEGFKELFIPEEVVIFQWAEWLREYMEGKLDEVESKSRVDEEDSRNRENSGINHRDHNDGNINGNHNDESSNVSDLRGDFSTSNADELNLACPSITHGTPLEHKKSVFVAHLAPVNNVNEVKAVREALLSNKKIARATHNILAYRIVLEGGVILQDNDDDGEDAAGGRLLHLLQILDAKNVLVIVSRWYGGIKLGPDRFKDINNCARDLLEQCGYINGTAPPAEGGSKKHKKTKK